MTEMSDFAIGFASSLAATIFCVVVAKYAWPAFQNKAFYRGVRVSGSWDIYEDRDGESHCVGRLKLSQAGRTVTGESMRSRTRGGEKSERRFEYTGSINGHQLTLTFEDKKGQGFLPLLVLERQGKLVSVD